MRVEFFDHESEQFMHCFSAEVDLSYEGFFVLSGHSGMLNPDYLFINSFELYDPYQSQRNHHYQDSHAKKATYEALADHMKEKV